LGCGACRNARVIEFDILIEVAKFSVKKKIKQHEAVEASLKTVAALSRNEESAM
jgi:hypothetical protein